MADPDDESELRFINDERFKPKKPCNTRIDELAKPNKRLVLGLWEGFAHYFSPEKREAIRLMVQEYYAMTPEESAKYFDEINKVLKKMAARQRLKTRLQKKYRRKVWRIERRRAYQKFGKLLEKGMIHANKHPVPPLVSPRIRNMADVILEQISDIRGIPMPDRSDIDQLSQFLVNISDWLAIAIEQIYYEIQVHKNQQLDMIEAEIKAKEEAEKKSKKSRRSSKTSRTSSKLSGAPNVSTAA